MSDDKDAVNSTVFWHRPLIPVVKNGMQWHAYLPTGKTVCGDFALLGCGTPTDARKRMPSRVTVCKVCKRERPTAGTPIFNEDSLRREITGKWGAHGAHAEVYSMLLIERNKLKAALARRDELLRSVLVMLERTPDIYQETIRRIRRELEGK